MTGTIGRMIRLLHAPHRLFFFAGVLNLLLASLWWSWVLLARARGLPGPLPEGLAIAPLHAYLMIYGFFPLFIFGFVFTAGPRWLAVPAPEPVVYIPLGVTAALAAAAFHPAMALPAPAQAVVVAAQGLATFAILVVFARLIVVSPAEDRVHAKAVAAALAMGVAGIVLMVAWLLTGSMEAARAMEIAGVWGFLVPVFCAVCHRMIPFFSSSALAAPVSWRPMWVLGVLLAGSFTHGLMLGLGMDSWLWIVDAPLAALVFVFAWRWGIAQSLSNRLLAMLHLGFVWLGIAWGLHAVQSLARLAGIEILGLAPVHALTIGFLASLAVAMVSRVSCGHSGRVLAADRLTWNAFLLLQCAAVLRVSADVWPSAYHVLLVAAACFWLASFSAWAWRYLPIYWQPRVDGKPG